MFGKRQIDVFLDGNESNLTFSDNGPGVAADDANYIFEPFFSVLTRLGEITRQRVRLGGREKIVHLCQQFVRKRDGVWRVDGPLPDLLFAETIG